MVFASNPAACADPALSARANVSDSVRYIGLPGNCPPASAAVEVVVAETDDTFALVAAVLVSHAQGPNVNNNTAIVKLKG
jgi:hypothetical protein